MPSAAIYGGIAGPALGADERAFYKSADPLGYILFQRNCVSRSQVRALTDELRALSGRADVPILIDEEGGRVQRLKPPEWRTRVPMRTFGRLYEVDRARGVEAARMNVRLIAEDLAELGVNVDCVPCLDVPAPGSHNIIGDRAFGTDPKVVAALGRIVGETMIEAGVLPVIKHIPGHGRATLDTHDALPHVSSPRAELSKTDFAPFRDLADMPLAMTAHVVFDAVDSECATLSSRLIGDVIRGEIGFDGLLMTDDVSMKALSGTLRSRAVASLKAGCDVVLHCNGSVKEMEDVATAVPVLSGKALARADAALARLKRQRTSVIVAEAERRLGELLA